MGQNKIYVGNLSYNVSESDLHEHFSQYGDIEESKLIIDRETGRSKGFAFITYSNPEAAKASLESDGHDLQGRNIRVSLAREDRQSSGGGRR